MKKKLVYRLPDGTVKASEDGQPATPVKKIPNIRKARPAPRLC